MNKKDIIKAIVDKHADFTQKEVGIIVDEFLDVIQDEISKGHKVSLAKFGTFEVVHRPAREGRNPQTGEPMTIAASDSPKFKPAKAFKDFVNMQGGDFLERIIFKDIHDLATRMIDSYYDGEDCVSAICHYDIATALLSELIKYDLPISQIDIGDYEWNGYDREYQVSIMNDKIYCNPSFVYKKDGYSRDRYLDTWANVIYIHQDVNSTMLKHIECDVICEFAIEDLDDVEDENCDDNITTYQSDSVTISRDKSGNPTGFTKSWTTTDKDGLYQYNSYTYYCSNKDMLKNFAQILDIDL